MLLTEPLSIRRYESGDDAFIAALARDAFDEYTPHAVSHTWLLVQHSITLVALQEASPRGSGAVDGAEGTAPARRVGFAALADEGRGTFVLNAIAVVRSQRGRGIGQRLMS